MKVATLNPYLLPTHNYLFQLIVFIYQEEQSHYCLSLTQDSKEEVVSSIHCYYQDPQHALYSGGVKLMAVAWEEFCCCWCVSSSQTINFMHTQKTPTFPCLA